MELPCGVQLVAPHGWGNPAGRVDTLASPVSPPGGSWAWRLGSVPASDSAVMTLPSAMSERLMLPVSFMVPPVDLLCLRRSEPARSTNVTY